TEEAQRGHCQQALNRARKELPDNWQTPAERFGFRELNDWRTQLDELIGKQTAERGRDFQQAQGSLELLRQDKRELGSQQSRFTEEARREPALIQASLQEAKQVYRSRDEELSLARQSKALLENHQQQRRELQLECQQAEQEYNYFKLLAGLLGRDRLQ